MRGRGAAGGVWVRCAVRRGCGGGVRVCGGCGAPSGGGAGAGCGGAVRRGCGGGVRVCGWCGCRWLRRRMSGLHDCFPPPTPYAACGFVFGCGPVCGTNHALRPDTSPPAPPSPSRRRPPARPCGRGGWVPPGSGWWGGEVGVWVAVWGWGAWAFWWCRPPASEPKGRAAVVRESARRFVRYEQTEHGRPSAVAHSAPEANRAPKKEASEPKGRAAVVRESARRFVRYEQIEHGRPSTVAQSAPEANRAPD